MHKNELIAKCHAIANETGIDFNSVLTHYFLESILEKIASSEEKNNFIFKGGFILSNIIGIRERTTKDIDFIIRNFKLTEEEIKQKLLKIFSSGKDNGVTYEIKGITKILNEDEYGGFRVNILCKLDNLKKTIKIDIATGDLITPNEIEYRYKSLFTDEYFEICSYNIETIIAEKIHILYDKSLFNSRMKDFYDIYILFHLKKDEINFRILKKACENTFKYRNTEFDIDKIIKTTQLIQNEERIRKQWTNYQKQFPYASAIEFENVIKTVDKVLQEINSIS
ncbi:MAG: nucleotidyl transferase AbiEii/AbiGii toxin family protein [Bacilli bacterium]|jgi:predicted nucleotidyltransferase component of viral defense system